MATIKKYTKKDGSTAYMFNAYLGIDPLTGKSKRTTRRGFKTQKEAKLALAQIQIEIDRGKFVKQDYSLFKDVYELWYAQYINTVKPSSAQRIKYYFDKQILPAFGELKLTKISPSYCQKVVNEWSKKYKRFDSMKMYTSKIFEFAITQNLLSMNPMKRIIMPKRQREIKTKEDQNFLDKDQLQEFLTLAKQKESMQYYTAFHLLAYTGMRKSELAALNWSDINWNANTISINKNVSYTSGQRIITTTKTTSSDRTISIDEITLNILKKWKLEQKKELLSRGFIVQKDEKQLIFSNPSNEIMSPNVLWEKLKTYKNFSISPHGFRHTHASLLFESGATIKQVQERLGHSNINTTLNIYTHVTKNAEKDVANKFLTYMNS
ncbi:TPA: tyrosine-type recombinase/integrase [Enterococcus faecalis]|uniref:site-specific integrase n=1 Tax=Enterococcus TaxID=1350 RepID=UPI00032FFC1C|nr:site-specific integrase [Enterococcus faecalis]EGO2589268.1 site-specific integrase [Enterococcus faecalis]EGO7953729.1 site-specific integrase [Enterococcus faecalis]EGS8054355.1 site-specific integrase [Enterococcus faecalis]EHG8748897.1 site-specific integrase [Enterococcus faecalis]EHZ0459073.1 site-specific integrase [Enterococcus faecalis]